MSESLERVGAFFINHRFFVRIAIGVVILAASIAVFVFSQKDPPARTSSIGARLELSAGDVTLKDGTAWPSVISGVALSTGAELATGKGARALVRLSDGSSVFLRSDSRIALGVDGVTVGQGEVWLDAPPSERGSLVHHLGDVTVSAADAGLSMRVDASGEVTVVVTRGLAVVTSPAGRVETNAGEQAKIAKAAPPKVSPLAYWDDWTGGMGDHSSMNAGASGAGRIYGVDPAAAPGTPARTLEISRQSVHAVLRDGLAETAVDQTFSNPGGRQVEGWYWFTVPERAIVTSFSVETDGQLIEGEVIERQEAAAQYGAAVRTGHEPALLEWIDGRSYRARIYPVPASGSRRVVLRYMELLSAQNGKLGYVYPMRTDDSTQIGEFSLAVDLGTAGVGMQISTLADAVVEEGGRRVTMRRSGYTPRADFQLEASSRAPRAPMRVARYSAGGDRADYIMARYVPDLDWQGVKDLTANVAIVVDTSASGDDAARAQKASAAEAILRSLSDKDRFSLIALDSKAEVLYPKEGLAEASDKEIAVALERLAEHASGGATDLGALFDAALSRVHGTEQPAIVYIGDGLATIGEVSGDKLAERLRRSLSVSRARFFTVAVGLEANYALLGELSRAGGGQPFRIDEVEAGTQEVLRLASAIKTPTITDLAIDLGAGLDEVLVTANGKIARGEEVILLARTHHALPKAAKVKGRLGGKDFEREYTIEVDTGVGVALVPRLWAAEKMRRLLGEASDPDEPRGKVVELGLEYGLMTPFTSILALESEQAYQQQGIQRRRSPLRGVRLTSLDPQTEEAIIARLVPPVAAGCAQKEAPASSEVSPMSRGAAQAPAPVMPSLRAEAAATAVAAMPDQQEQAKPSDDSARDKSPGGGGAAKTGGRAKSKCMPGDPLCSDGDFEENQPQPTPTAAAPEPPPPPPSPAVAPSAPRPALAVAKGTTKPRADKPAEGKQQAQRREEPIKTDTGKKAVWRRALGQCSDSARRPLAERIVIWSKRLRGAPSVDELIARFEGAKATCEVPDWRAEAALLELIQAKVRTEGAAAGLLAHFSGEPDTQTFIAQAILRRTVDPRIAGEVRKALFGDKINWVDLDNQLAELATPADRIARLRAAMATAPGDPEGDLRLVRLLAEAGQREDALAHGRRLRDKGLVSPALALQLGDVLSAQKFEDEAQRTYSEIVEFDATSADSRRLLGDVFLRHGWYAPAYRQYKTLTEVDPNDASSFLRMAAAAAGSGRVDEALRIQRQVATAEGTAGQDDPRVWARFWSAARLARLMAGDTGPADAGSAKPTDPGYADSLARKLKELQIFSGPSALVLVTWEDFGASLSLISMDGDREAALADPIDASPVGLTGASLAVPDLDRLKWIVRWRADPPGRDVRFSFHSIVWDGKSFVVKTRSESLASGQKEIAL